MQKLLYPSAEFRIQRRSGKLQIFDPVRRKFVQLTPEEWIRQHILYFLIETLGYPRALIASESGLKYNKMSKRSDVVVYTNEGDAFLLVECKASHINISQNTMDQLSVYNQVLNARYLAVTNGLQHFIACVDYESRTYQWLEKFPEYPG